METFNNFTEAENAAEQFFSEHFDYNSGVGIESQKGDIVEFYSKDDPGMDDTYTCKIKN